MPMINTGTASPMSAEPTANVSTVEELAALAGVVLRQTDLTATLVEICEIAARAVPGAEAASITTLSNGQPNALANGDWGRELDELQFAEHEGPCLDAYRTGTVFRVRNFADDGRWPAYGPRALERGAVSMISIALSAEGQVIGALNLYAKVPDAFDGYAVSVAEVVADHAGLASQVAAAFYAHKDLAEELAEAMRSRATIEQAKGVLIARNACSPDEAFQLLVVASSTSHRKLRDVATETVADAMRGAG